MSPRLWQSILLVTLCSAGAALAMPLAAPGDESAGDSKSQGINLSGMRKHARAEASGGALYDRFCLACHGSIGDGRGPARPLLWPQPRDFRSGDYKWRTTGSGKPPTDNDLRTTIRFGVPGTSMHGFAATLGEQQVSALIKTLKSFAPRKFSRDATPLPISSAPPPADAERGKALFSTLGCVKCHGSEAGGDGPSAAALRDSQGRVAAPYDLRTIPLRRPHAPGANPRRQIYLSLLTGLSGSPMPAYEGAAPEADLWQVASYVQSIRSTEPTPNLNNSSQMPPQAQRFDARSAAMKTGFYPGHGSAEDRALFGGEIMPQGRPPAGLTPAQASLDSKRCARCHNRQVRDWRGSLHAGASSPGLVAQLIAMERNSSWSSLQSCQRCHNPLAEQSPVLSAAQRGAPSGYLRNPNYSESLRQQGVNCATCHLRKWQRYGPPTLASSKRLALPGYPLTELPLYERSDFCMPCHQLPTRNTLAGAPLLNTYKEWLEGPYMRRGVQCQHCHMPDREHTWKGIHDADTFRQGITVSAIAGRSASGTVSVRVKVRNSGAGHYLPTTPTPAAWVSIELLDQAGNPIEGAAAKRRIGRHLVYDRGWKQVEDTRIPPGESLELARAWKAGRVAEARVARIRVRVEPDEYYERLYLERLRASNLPAEERLLFEQALQRTRDSQYLATEQLVPLAGARIKR